jgi:hypothetical protein
MAAKIARRVAKPVVAVNKKHPTGALAAQIDTKDGSVVMLGNLRVLITKDDGSWVAQGLEIDYAIDGENLTAVKQRFETGLAMTVESNIRVYGNIDNMLKVAPPEVWADYYADRNTLRRFKHSQVRVFNLQDHLPFDGIEFYEKVDGTGDKVA